MTEAGLLRNAIEKATKEVFEMMLDAEISLENRPLENNPNDTPVESGVVSLVGLTGNWSGTGTVSCSPAVASRVASRMLMMDAGGASSIDDEVLDAVAELTNMVVGNIKNLLSEELGEMALSIPTVVYGRNFRFKNVSGMSEEVAVFRWEEYRFEVKLCLAPALQHSAGGRQRLTPPALGNE